MVTPLLTLWSNCSLALSDRSCDSFHIIIVNCVILKHFSTQVPEMLLRFFVYHVLQESYFFSRSSAKFNVYMAQNIDNNKQ